MVMKVLTLHEPWATAMEVGYKGLETREWRTPYRGLVAIHSGQSHERVDLAASRPFYGMFNDPAVKETLGWVNHQVPFMERVHALPGRGIVAVGLLQTCELIVDPDDQFGYYQGHDWGREKPLGDCRTFRWAWVFGWVWRVHPHVPLKGAPGLQVLPPDVEETVLGQMTGKRTVAGWDGNRRWASLTPTGPITAGGGSGSMTAGASSTPGAT